MAKVRKRKWTHNGKVGEAYIVDWFDASGKRRQKTFQRKKEAHAYRVTVEGELSKGTHTPDSISKTVSAAAEKWLDQCALDGLEFSSVRQYRQHVEGHIKPFIGDVKLSQLTAPMVREFVNDLRKDGRSDSMARKVLTSMKTLMSHAHQHGMVAQNVARDVKLKISNRHKARVEIPTKAELRAIIETAETERFERWRPLLVTAIFTGLRASELRGLRWQDVDFEAGELHVEQRADAWGTLGSPKSQAGRRTVPMAPVVANTLKEWKLKCPTGDLDLVFANEAGNVQDHSAFYKRHFGPLLVAARVVKEGESVAKYTFHSLRHAAASMFIEQGWQPKKVQTVMGHSSIQMTYDVYGHLFPSPDDDREAMAQIQARLLG